MVGRYVVMYKEDGEFISPGGIPRSNVFDDVQEAMAYAKRKVDDAQPNLTVHVLEDYGFAYLAGDGSEGWSYAEQLTWLR